MIPKCNFSRKLWDSADPDSTRSSCVPRPLALPRPTETDGERERARARETKRRFHTTDLILWNLSSTLIGYQWDLGPEICSHSVQWLRSWWREHKAGQIEIPKRFTGSRYLVDYRERERRFHTRNSIVWNLSSTLIGYHWDLGPGTCSHGIHWLRSSWREQRVGQLEIPKQSFVFCPESGTHMFYRISIHLVKRRSTSFRTSVVKKLARSPQVLKCRHVVSRISIDVLNGTTLH
jgi:hypothetical protein